MSNLGVVDHPAADERHPAVELGRQIHNDLHAVDAGSEGRHDDFAVGVREDLFEGVGDVDFRPREAAAIDVRAVGEKREDTGSAELRQAVDVDALAVDRRLVDLEVAGVDDDTLRCLYRDRDTVRDAVRNPQELDRERADSHTLPRTNGRRAARATRDRSPRASTRRAQA